MTSLADIQDAFTAALRDPHQPTPPALTTDCSGHARGFDVYRNNRASTLVDALAAVHPAVQRLVGEAFFRAAARLFIDQEPPRGPLLHCYGAGFGDFLDAFPPASTVPYLGDMARLEWSYLRAYHAADETPLAIEALAEVPTEHLATIRLRLHPAVTLHRSRWPIGSLWSQLLAATDPRELDMSCREDVLVARRLISVEVRVLPEGAFELVAALAEGATLAQAVERASATGLDFDLASQLRGLFDAGAIAGFHPTRREQHDCLPVRAA